MTNNTTQKKLNSPARILQILDLSGFRLAFILIKEDKFKTAEMDPVAVISPSDGLLSSSEDGIIELLVFH